MNERGVQVPFRLAQSISFAQPSFLRFPYTERHRLWEQRLSHLDDTHSPQY